MFDWRERRVLVTGATGIVGSHLCKALVARGAYVVAFIRDDDPQASFYRDGIVAHCSVVRGELARYTDCKRAINAHDVEIVFHLGAQTLVGTAIRDPLDTFDSNIRGTYNLLEAARCMQQTVRAVVVASSDKAYGDSDELPYTEDMPLRGRHPYDVSKSCTDLLATCYAQTYDVPLTIARCGNIYGAGDLNWSRIVPGTIRSLLLGERPILRSDGRSIRDYIFVDDVVSAYMLLAEQVARPEVCGEAFNFSPETELTVFDIVDAISRLMDIRLEPIVCDVAVHEIRNQTLSSKKARETLGWNARFDLEAGLRETIPWYRQMIDRDGAVFADAVR